MTTRSLVTRFLVTSFVCSLPACSFLAPTDAELMGGHRPAEVDPGAGGANDGASPADAGSSGVTGPGGQSGEAGFDFAMAGNGPDPIACDGNHEDCNHVEADGCETDVTSNQHCGGCGPEFACAKDTQCLDQRCVSVSGCSDGTRDGFTPLQKFKTIAGCAANWPLGSLLTERQGPACGSSSTDCRVPADACGAFWHVCGTTAIGAAEVSERMTAGDCNAMENAGAFVIAVGDQGCACTADGSGAACCGSNCIQQHGSCVYPGVTAWYGVFNGHKNTCGSIEAVPDGRTHGVLCCRDAI